MVGWEESDLGAPSLQQATEILRPLCEATYDPATDDSTLDEIFPDSIQNRIRDIRDQCGSPTPLMWVRSGTETLQQLTSSPVSLQLALRRSVDCRARLIGDRRPANLLADLVRGTQASNSDALLIPAIREIIGGAGRPGLEREIAVVGGPFEGATVDAESIRSIQGPSRHLRQFWPQSLCLICLRSIPLTAVDCCRRRDWRRPRACGRLLHRCSNECRADCVAALGLRADRFGRHPHEQLLPGRRARLSAPDSRRSSRTSDAGRRCALFAGNRYDRDWAQLTDAGAIGAGANLRWCGIDWRRSSRWYCCYSCCRARWC